MRRAEAAGAGTGVGARTVFKMLAIITKATVAEIAGTDSRNRALAFISASPLVVVIPGADDTSPCII